MQSQRLFAHQRTVKIGYQLIQNITYLSPQTFFNIVLETLTLRPPPGTGVLRTASTLLGAVAPLPPIGLGPFCRRWVPLCEAEGALDAKQRPEMTMASPGASQKQDKAIHFLWAWAGTGPNRPFITVAEDRSSERPLMRYSHEISYS